MTIVLHPALTGAEIVWIVYGKFHMSTPKMNTNNESRHGETAFRKNVNGYVISNLL